MRNDDLGAVLTETFPFVQLLCTAEEVKHAYEEMLSRAKSELVMFTRPPYAWKVPNPNPVVLAMLERGVRARVLYLASHWADPRESAFREETSVYHAAGVQARLAEELPVKLIVVDRQVAVIGNPAQAPSPGVYPPSLMVDDAGFATVLAAAFERAWDASRPLPAEGAPQ